MTHTPGPWRVGIEGNNRVYGPDCMGEHTGLVAVVYKTPANKHLVAAAPDMLEALELALEYWAHRQQRYKNRHPVWVQKARAAITKAKAAIGEGL